jgi:hypothetical protein
MTHKDLFNSVNKVDLLKDIDNFHKKYGFEKNEKVGIPNDNELSKF